MAQIENETIGQRIAKYRHIEGWSAQKLASESQISRSIITNIENGRKEDVTVRELLAISFALRVPAAALLYPIDRPLKPELSPETTFDPFGPSVISLVEWLAASDSSLEVDPDLAEFDQNLEDLDGVVVYPIGIRVLATYGKAGRHARSLLHGARALKRALGRFEVTRMNVLLFIRDVWSNHDDTDISDQAIELLESGDFASSVIGRRFLADVAPEDQSAVAKLMREHDASARNFQEAQAQFRLIGGQPETGGTDMTPGRAMGMVQSMPHESISDREANGFREEGFFASPLRRTRSESYERLRRRLGLQVVEMNGSDVDGDLRVEHKQTP